MHIKKAIASIKEIEAIIPYQHTKALTMPKGVIRSFKSTDNHCYDAKKKNDKKKQELHIIMKNKHHEFI